MWLDSQLLHVQLYIWMNIYNTVNENSLTNSAKLITITSSDNDYYDHSKVILSSESWDWFLPREIRLFVFPCSFWSGFCHTDRFRGHKPRFFFSKAGRLKKKQNKTKKTSLVYLPYNKLLPQSWANIPQCGPCARWV